MTPSPIVPRPYSLPTPSVLPPVQSYAHHNQANTLAAPLSSASPPLLTDSRDLLYFCFCIPFKLIPGPDLDDVVVATEGAAEKWIHTDSTPISGTHKLPVHQKNLDYLRRICRDISETDGCKAFVTVGEPRTVKRKKRGAVMNVSLSGDADTVYRMRGIILQSLPVSLKCSTLDIENELIYTLDDRIVEGVEKHLNDIARYTGTDIFLLRPHVRTPHSVNDTSQAERLRLQIYGDLESVECAKTKMLLMIDDILKQIVHVTSISVSLCPLICGRARKNVQLIEATTRTCIYFPNLFPGVFGYRPDSAAIRHPDQIYITGSTQEGVRQAERMLVDLMMNLQVFTKSATIAMLKADYIILERLDDVKKIMEANGTFVQFPALGTTQGVIRVQGSEAIYVEKTIKQIMQITGQFYNASWWLLDSQATPDKLRPPTDRDIHQMLSDISGYSGAEISYNSRGFEIHGSDEAVKMALEIANEIRFVKQSAYQIRVKIELANEHKEFVAGKKNGKINKIMGQSNVQVMFEGFNEYNFYICVVASKYEPAMLGLELVEQELPAAVSFYVPDQYHKRIIGIQGAHIQRLMKKYSVYVKFLNPTEREVGSGGWLDADLTGDNNVVIRTPARNAANLELVKGEIMDTVQKVDAEIVVETVVVPRLYHRSLIANMPRIQELERKWGCTIIFPSSEEASDNVLIKGPEWQLPDAVNEFLSLVPEQHKMRMAWTPSLEELVNQESFKDEIANTVREKFNIDVVFCQENQRDTQAVSLTYTRNNTGNLQDAIDFITTFLAKHGVNSEPIRGGIGRPKSDTFEESFPYFNSKVLQSAPLPMGTDEAKRLSGEVTASMQADLARLIANSNSEQAFNSVKPPGSAGSNGSSSSRRSTVGNGVGVVGQETMQKRLSISSTGSAPMGTNIWGNNSAEADTDWPIGNGLVGGLERPRGRS
ncbi:hypothetical protein DFH27DRAFT_268154 [Peziza echinospora]|nr:hypothetical protein DFH27DRAFT_268154 [Peziza echinospora]